MKKNNKIFLTVGMILTIVVLLFGLDKWWHHNAIITLHYVDQNGTSITYDRTIVTRTGYVLRMNPEYKKVHGYRLLSKNKKIVVGPIHTKEYDVMYKPTDEDGQLSKIKESKYIAVTFQPMAVSTTKNGAQSDPFALSRSYDGQTGRDSLRIIYSNNGVSWHKANINYPRLNVRDPSIKKIGRYYYIIYTHGLVRTRNFKNWQQLKWDYSSKYSNEWAPEFFETKSGKVKIIMSASLKHSSKFQLYTADFKYGQIQNNWKKVSGNSFPDNMIDGHVDVINGKYYLWYKNENTKRLMCKISNNFSRGYRQYSEAPKFFDGMEGPETIWKNQNSVYLYFDTYDLPEATFHGVHYLSSKDGGRSWSGIKRLDTPFLIRHFEPIVNN